MRGIWFIGPLRVFVALSGPGDAGGWNAGGHSRDLEMRTCPALLEVELQEGIEGIWGMLEVRLQESDASSVLLRQLDID